MRISSLEDRRSVRDRNAVLRLYLHARVVLLVNWSVPGVVTEPLIRNLLTKCFQHCLSKPCAHQRSTSQQTGQILFQDDKLVEPTAEAKPERFAGKESRT
jgi:hypothetical protein